MKKNELIENYLTKRSDEAFEKIVKLYSPLVYSACMRKLNDENISKDLSQQVFLDFLNKVESLVKHPNIAGWFYQAALFRAANHLRKSSREEARMKKLHEIHDINEETKSIWLKKIKPELDDAIQQIPTKLRDAIIQHYLLGSTVVEASKELCISKDAMHKRLARGREILKGILSKKHKGLTSAILLSVLSSNELRAAPIGLVKSITVNSSSGISTLLPLKGKIIAMTTLNKTIIGAAALVLTGSIAFSLLTDNNLEDSNAPTESVKNQVENVKNQVENLEKQKKKVKGPEAASTKPRKRIKISVNQQSFKENNLKNKELLDYIIGMFSEDQSKWYEILRAGGISIDEALFNEILDRELNGNAVTKKTGKMFLLKLFSEWGSSQPEAAVSWLLERDLHSAPPLARYIFHGIADGNITEAARLLDNLPDSKEKDRISSLVKPAPFEEIIDDYNQNKDKYNLTDRRTISALSNKMILSDPLKALSWAKETLGKSQYRTFLESSSYTLASKNPELALEILSKESKENPISIMIALERAMGGIVNSAPEKATQMLSLFPDHAYTVGLSKALEHFIVYNNKTEEAINWVQTLDEKYKGYATIALSAQMAKKDFDSAIEYAENNLPEPVLKKVLLEIAAESANYDVEKSAPLVEDIIDRGNIQLYDVHQDKNMSSPESIQNSKLHTAVSRIVRNTILSDPDMAVSWLKTIPFKDHSDYQKVLVKGLTAWHVNHPKKAKSWVLTSNLESATVDQFMKEIERRNSK